MIGNALAESEVMDVLSDAWAPVRQESVCDWIEKNVELPTGAITGKVQLKYTPYLREILERYGDKKTRHLVLAFATQLAKTSALIWGMLYRVARDPEDAMWVMGNDDQARDFNKERFHRFVDLCPPVLDMVPRTSHGVINKHLFGFKNQHYKNMVLNFVGAGSPTNLSSRPRGLITMDEVDKYYDQLGFDAGSIDLAEERQKTFHFPMSVKASSPTLADRMIWVQYLKTDQRQFWLPCPRCEKKILLKMKAQSEKHGDCGLRWWHEHESEAKTDGVWDMEKVRALAHYKCQCCGGMIHSFEREDMLQEGVWIPQNLRAETGRYGYNLSSLYSILGAETSLASIAIKFLTSKGLAKEFKNFVNGWLAEPWDESRAYDFQEVRLTVFTSQDIPKDDSTPLMAIDVQENGYWVLVRRFQPPNEKLPHGQSWLLFADWVQTEEELVEIQNDYGVEGENVTADMAQRPNVVSKLIIEHGWRGIWGSPNTKVFYHKQPDGTRLERPFSEVKFRDPHLGTSWANRTPQRARFIRFSKDAALDMVSSLRYADQNPMGDKKAIWHSTVNANPKYSRHLNSRVKRMQKNRRTGRPEWVWVELHQDNHLADCESHVTIRAFQLGLLALPPESSAQEVRDS